MLYARRLSIPRIDHRGFFVTAEADLQYMRQALKLAEKGRGRTSPNPMVGAILVKGGSVVGRGYHRAVGRDHAEIVALKDAGRRARGSTMYVTLEPCCHTGRTGPCSQAIIEAGITRLFYAAKDPDPRVNGKSARLLRKAGIEVTSGLLRREARRLNDRYFGYVENGRPFVILKYAQSLDGRIATRTGDSKWISGRESLKLAHRLRSEVDAVVVGSGTVRTDDPALTVRLVKGNNPYRIVVSASMNLPVHSRLLKDNKDCRTILATTAAAREKFARRKRLPHLIFWDVGVNRNGGIDIEDLMRKAMDFGFQSLLVEGGAELATSFVKSGLVDKYVVITAPVILGKGVNAIGELNVRTVADGIYFDDYMVEKSGGDCVFVGYPGRKVR